MFSGGLEVVVVTVVAWRWRWWPGGGGGGGLEVVFTEDADEDDGWWLEYSKGITRERTPIPQKRIFKFIYFEFFMVK